MRQVNSAVSYERCLNNEVIFRRTFLTWCVSSPPIASAPETHNYHIVPASVSGTLFLKRKDVQL